jgi:hypothetical protein
MSFRIRFNLGRGNNYQKWQVKDNSNGEVFYLTPESFNLELLGCTLRNQKSAASKIYGGANKNVCAWVQCDDIVVRSSNPLAGGILLRYNPKVNPNWTCGEDDVDGEKFERLTTYKRNIYIDKL